MSQLTWLPPLNSHENFAVKVHAVQGGRLRFNPGSSSKPPESLSVRVLVDVLFYDRDTKARNILRGLSTTDFETFQLANTGYSNVLNDEYISLHLPLQLDDDAYYYYSETQEGYTTLATKGDLIELFSNFLKFLVESPLNAGFEEVQADLIIEKWIQLPSVELDAYIELYEGQDQKAYEKAIGRPRTESELEDAALWYESYKESINMLRTDGNLSKEDNCREAEVIEESTSSTLMDLVANLIPSYFSQFFTKAKNE